MWWFPFTVGVSLPAPEYPPGRIRGPIGIEGEAWVRAVDPEGQWVVLCQPTADTDGNGMLTLGDGATPRRVEGIGQGEVLETHCGDPTLTIGQGSRSPVGADEGMLHQGTVGQLIEREETGLWWRHTETGAERRLRLSMVPGGVLLASESYAVVRTSAMQAYLVDLDRGRVRGPIRGHVLGLTQDGWVLTDATPPDQYFRLEHPRGPLWWVRPARAHPDR